MLVLNGLFELTNKKKCVAALDICPKAVAYYGETPVTLHGTAAIRLSTGLITRSVIARHVHAGNFYVSSKRFIKVDE